MALDPYSLCPCGSGKKLKFCCSDLVHEMEKIQRMLEGEQRAACLDYLKSLTAKHPSRGSLLGLQAMLQVQLEQYDAARQTLDHFLSLEPDNVAGLTEQAMLLVATQGGRAAVPVLQHAIEGIGREMPVRTYEALGAVGQALLIEGELLAARAHLSLQAGIAADQDPRPMGLLMRVLGSNQLPVLLKDDWQLAPAPADAPWKEKFEEALQHAGEGAWQRAAREFEALVEPSGGAPQVWRNLGLTRSWVADVPGAVEALHQYAASEVPLDDAVEFEALAQLLTPPEQTDTVEVVQTVYPIRDFEALSTALADAERMTRVPIETYMARTDNAGPPPRAALALLDRAELRRSADLAIDVIPEVIGYVYLFGRETDREPRAELIAQGEPHIQQARDMLTQLGGDALGAEAEVQKLGEVPRLSHVLSWNWRLPEETPREQRLDLIGQKRRAVIFHAWPQTPQPALGGKSLADAARDPALRVKSLAAVLVLEMALQPHPQELDLNELRRELGLPEAGPVDPATLEDRRHIPLARLARIEVEKLSEDELVQQYHRAVMLGLTAASWKLTHEIVRRGGIEGKVDQAEALGQLAELATSPAEAQGYLDEARSISKSRGESCAPWDLAELALQLEAGDAEQARDLFEHIRAHHGREPGVAQHLAELLIDAGILRPDGTPAGPPPEAKPSLIVPGAEEPGKIWTPDGGAAGERKIWTPD